MKKLAKKAAKKSGVSAGAADAFLCFAAFSHHTLSHTARTVMTIRTDENGKPLAIEDVKTQTTPTIEFPMPDSPASRTPALGSFGLPPARGHDDADQATIHYPRVHSTCAAAAADDRRTRGRPAAAHD